MITLKQMTAPREYPRDSLDLEFQPVERDLLANEKRKLHFLNTSVGEYAPFPTLREVFKKVNPNTGINVEIKFPYEIENGGETGEIWIPPMHVDDINHYVDTILEEVLNYAGNRNIFFSSFDPDVLVALRLKQTRWPASLLTRVQPYMPKNKDLRMTEPKLAHSFVKNLDLTGINFIADYLLENSHAIKELHDSGHVVYAWQSNMTAPQIINLTNLGVDGLIYDGIDKKKHLLKGMESLAPESSSKSRSSETAGQILTKHN